MSRKISFVIVLLLCAMASLYATSGFEYRPGQVLLDGYGHVIGCASPGNQCYYVYWEVTPFTPFP